MEMGTNKTVFQIQQKKFVNFFWDKIYWGFSPN